MNEKVNLTISNSEFFIFCLPLKVKLISASKAFPTVGYMHTWITSTIFMINTIRIIIIVDVFVNSLFVNKRGKEVTHKHLSLNLRSQLLSWLGALQKQLLLPFYNRGYVEGSLGKNICLWKNKVKKERKLYCSARCILMGLFVFFVKWILFLIF